MGVRAYGKIDTVVAKTDKPGHQACRDTECSCPVCPSAIGDSGRIYAGFDAIFILFSGDDSRFWHQGGYTKGETASKP